MHEIQEKATTHKVFMKIIRPWPGRSGYLEKFSDLTSNGMARFCFFFSFQMVGHAGTLTAPMNPCKSLYLIINVRKEDNG